MRARQYAIRFPDGQQIVYDTPTLKDAIVLFHSAGIHTGRPEYIEWRVLASGEMWRLPTRMNGNVWTYDYPDLDKPTVRARA
jgi:hypothetical protein